jgi:hypothetical protein
MSVHPARVVAATLLIGGSLVVGVAALAIVFAKLLVDQGMAVRPADALLLNDLLTVLPLILVFVVTGFAAAAGLLLGTAWSDDLAFGIALVAVAIGSIGLILLSVGRDPFASTVTARSTNDGIGIIGAFTVLYLFVIVAVAVARLPRRTQTGVMA